MYFVLIGHFILDKPHFKYSIVTCSWLVVITLAQLRKNCFMSKNLILQSFWKIIKTEEFRIDYKWLTNIHHIPVCQTP